MSAAAALLLPQAWPLLAIVPLAWVTLWRLDRHRARSSQAIGGPKMHIRVRPPRATRRALFCGGLAFALIACLQPSWGEELRDADQKGIDILICLDVSQSMLARDEQPNRLRAAQRHIQELVQATRGDRLGLVTFAGVARLNVPLTQDINAFSDMVDLADPMSVPRGGTDLGQALDQALQCLEAATGDHEVILLLTDGEDLQQQGLRMAEECHQRNITVHCIGYGSTRGSKITIETERGEQFLRDQQGREVVSALDPASLREIAAATQGQFVLAGAGANPLLELYRTDILAMVQKAYSVDARRQPKNQYRWPLLVAILLWLLEYALADARHSPDTGRKFRTAPMTRALGTTRTPGMK